MREKRRNISWLSIFSFAFLPNEMLDKCNFQHMFDVNIMSLYLALTTTKKNLLRKKKVVKMFWFLACPCSFLPSLISFPDFSETNVDYFRKLRMLCGLRWMCSTQLMTIAGCVTGICSARPTATTAQWHPTHSPRKEARGWPVIFLLTATGWPQRH